MMSVGYFDSHAHLDDEKFTSSEGGSDAVVAASIAAGVSTIVNIGTNKETSGTSVALAEKYPFIYASVGIYPTDAQYLGDRFDSELEAIRSLAVHPKVVAIGEIGLDYHYDGTDRDVQMRAFVAQMELAGELHLPVVIHDREAHGDVLDVIRRYPDVKGVLHSFSGSSEMAEELCRRGWYISFSGPVTYKNAVKVKAAAKIVPSEYLMVETDSPYLPPTPHRGEVNYPGFISHTVAEIAALRGEDPDFIAALTSENAKRLFGI